MGKTWEADKRREKSVWLFVFVKKHGKHILALDGKERCITPIELVLWHTEKRETNNSNVAGGRVSIKSVKKRIPAQAGANPNIPVKKPVRKREGGTWSIFGISFPCITGFISASLNILNVCDARRLEESSVKETYVNMTTFYIQDIGAWQGLVVLPNTTIVGAIPTRTSKYIPLKMGALSRTESGNMNRCEQMPASNVRFCESGAVTPQKKQCVIESLYPAESVV